MLFELAGAALLLILIGVALWLRRQSAAVPTVRPTLPPSPYPPSRGFKLLDASGEVEEPAAPEAPKLAHEGELVFGDATQYSDAAPALTPQLRREEQWAIQRSMRRAPRLKSRRRHRSRLVQSAVVLLAIVGLLYVTHVI